MAAGDMTFVHGTPIWFVPAAATQAEDAALELGGVSSASGVQSAQYDLGVRTTAYTPFYLWRAFTQLQATTPVVNQSVDFYLKKAYSSSVNHIDNDDGTGVGALSSLDKLLNLFHLGGCVVDEVAASKPISKSGFVEFHEQFINIVVANNSGASTATSANVSGLVLIPLLQNVAAA